MGEPLSIVSGVVGLLALAAKVGIALKEFHDGAAMADTKVIALMTDVESFTKVLQSMEDTFGQKNAQISSQGTGHIGNHWANLFQTVQDGQVTLSRLKETLDKVNKTVNVLDSSRKHMRLKNASNEIEIYQHQIRSYRDTMQLTLQTIIYWNQTTFQETTDKITPNLNELNHEVRRLAYDINHHMAKLQSVVESNSNAIHLNALSNMRNCVQSAASIVSSASTALGRDQDDDCSVAYGSEFGDCFPAKQGEAMLRWTSSHTVYEFEELSLLEEGKEWQPNTGRSRLEDDTESEKSDSDSDLESEMIRSLLKQGKERAEQQDIETAERYFRNCLTRTSASGSLGSAHRASRSQALGFLIDIYCQQEKWVEAAPLAMEKVAMRSSPDFTDKGRLLFDTANLSEILLKKGAHAEALLYGRRALKGYRRLEAELGTSNIEKTLQLLVRICHAAGNIDDEDAYATILSDFQERVRSNQGVPESGEAENSTVSSRSAVEVAPVLMQDLASKEGELTLKPASGQVRTHQQNQSRDSPSRQYEIPPFLSFGKEQQPLFDFQAGRYPSQMQAEAPNSLEANGQLTPTSSTRFPHREPSLSSLGSAGPAPPYTANLTSDDVSHQSSDPRRNTESSQMRGLAEEKYNNLYTSDPARLHPSIPHHHSKLDEETIDGKSAAVVETVPHEEVSESNQLDGVKKDGTIGQTVAKPYRHRNIVIVGDVCGKTALLIAFSHGVFQEYCPPTFQGNYVTEIEMDNTIVELELRDTSGSEFSDRIRPMSYDGVHLTLICFGIDAPDSLENVLEKWISEILHFCVGLPIILVGLKKDLRVDPKTIKELAMVGQRPVTYQEADEVRKQIGAMRYIECSAKTNEGIREVFEQATRVALVIKNNFDKKQEREERRKKRKSAIRGLFRMSSDNST